MINVNNFSIDELWKQLYWVYIYDDLDDAKQLAPAIRHHPDLTDDLEIELDNFLAEILTDSIRRGSIPWVRFVLDEGAQITPLDVYEIIFNPLIEEVQRISMFDTFFERDWDVNSCDDNGAPFIHFVTHSIGLTTWFLDHGADPNQPDPRYQDSTLDSAARYGSLETMRLFLAAGARFNSGRALQLAVTRPEDDPIVMPILLFLLQDQSISVTGVQQDLDTALHAAVWRRSIPRAMLLLERGADPHQPGVSRPPPVQYARQIGDITMETLLIAWTSDIPKERDGWIVVDEEQFVTFEADTWEAINNGLQAMEIIEEEMHVENWVVPGLEREAPPPVV